MCGIIGYIDYSCHTTSEELVEMTNALTHRGPDSSDTKEFFSNKKIKLGLGHTRLSIIDLSSLGNQPMSKHGITTVFNGEIYNYQNLKKKLINYGYTFNSNSDTEVLISGYHKWGTDFFTMLNGMFAAIIYDSLKEQVLFLRDRAGVKPLYFFKKNDLILAASEVKSFFHHKAFASKLNMDSVASFLQYGYVPRQYSIYKDVEKVNPGHCYIYHLKTKKFDIKKYWNIKDFYRKQKLELPYNTVKSELTDILSSAFNYRMVSDVPVGVFLSGGYDSSAVAALIQANSTNKLDTYTIGFNNEKYNEAEYAKEIANHLGTNHHELYCTVKEAKDIIPELPYIYDEPFGDSSAIPTILVSRFARQNVTVALSADGGDEIFGGYEKHTRSLEYSERINKIKFKKQIGFLSSLLKFKNPKYDKLQTLLTSNKEISALSIMKYGSQMITEKKLSKLLKTNFRTQELHFDNQETNQLELESLLQTDYLTYLPDDILVKVDRASMSCSLESREPFLDHRIIEYVARLDSDFKIMNGEKKYILKDIVHDYIPKDMLDRPKKGFSLPIHIWLKEDLRYLIEDYLSDSKIEKQDIFKLSEIKKLKTQFFSGYTPANNIIWNLLMFQMWYQKWLS